MSPGEQLLQQRGEAIDELVQVDGGRREVMRACKRRELAGQLAGLSAGRFDLGEVPVRLLVRRRALPELREAADRREEVVEVVGYPGGGTSDHLETKRLAPRRLGPRSEVVGAAVRRLAWGRSAVPS